MTYTQANPLDESVRKALDRKVDLLRKRNTTGDDLALYYFTSRTPWIKLTSAVDVVGDLQKKDLKVTTDTELAVNYQLTSQYEEEHLPSGHANTSLGIRPRPGITSMDVRSHNQFGSLRTGKVNFQVWSKEDLDACEVLYMRPGMTVLLEWGWSLSLLGDGTEISPYKVQPTEKGVNIFKKRTNATLISLLTEIQEKKVATGHGYDAIFGYVKNFHWSLRQDGGYDCWSEIVTPGEILESLNLSYPVSNIDSSEYEKYIVQILSKEKDELKKSTNGLDESGISKFFNRYLAPGLLGERRLLSLTRESIRNSLIEDFHTRVSNVPDYSTQTSLATFLGTDLKSIIANSIEAQQSTSVIQDWDLKKSPDEARYLTRLFNTATSNLEPYKYMRLINWKGVELEKESDGNLKIVQGGTVKKEVTHPQYYIKYGLVLEVLNRYMLHSKGKAVVSFDINNSTTFNATATSFFSLDPASCLLPTDMTKLLSLGGEVVSSGGQNFVQAPQSSQNGPQPEPVVSISTKEEPTSILHIYLNVNMLEELIRSSNLQTYSSDGVPLTYLKQFVDNINARINQACAGTVELAIQYFEDEAKYAIVDRVNFQDPPQPEEEYTLRLIGNESIFHNISLNSSLTPEMTSALAISVQGDYKAHNNTEAGFLRFNEGIEDRVIQDRTPTGTFPNVDEKEPYTLSEADLRTVEELYNYIYGKGRWMPESVDYAKEIHNKYVTEILNDDNNKESLGRVVVPFSTSLTLDGTSGVKILHSFLIGENLLPYTYSHMKGGVGVLVTGIEASVDASKWVTTLNGQYYPRKSVIGASDLKNQLAKKEEVSSDHILYEYADKASQADFTAYMDGTTGMIKRTGFFPEKTHLIKYVKEHYEEYWKGQDESTIEKTADDKNTVNILEEYWKLVGRGWTSYSPEGNSGFIDKKAHYGVSWSAVYVSYIMSTFSNSIKYPFNPKAAHYLYAKDALDKLVLADLSGNSRIPGWNAFSLIDQSEIIKAEEGDILVAPREGVRTNSHGVIVYDTIGGKAKLAEGNASDTNRIDRTLQLIPKTVPGPNGTTRSLYVYPKGEKALSSYVLVLKYYGK